MAKANMSPVRNPMPTQDAAVRAHNFNEVALGYTEDMATDRPCAVLTARICPALTAVP